ncbi:glycoside hydrolase family 15 protein [Lichenicoccus sp.]|uniref:glycoside hydrolase family 15 protein n=1 Tax=Lichenicoccus sp. TaxID=2781899 RepID=UPI003D0FB895
MSNPIEDYALIGDGETAALVSRHGSVDWLCWPRFDDDSCFAALLGTIENGHWSIAPTAEVTANRRRYQDGTLVIETDIETPGGTVRLIDFMPMHDGTASSLVRIVQGVSGTVEMRLDMRLRFNYGALPPWSETSGKGFVAKVGPDLVVLHTPVQVSTHAHCASAVFEVGEGDRQVFVLRYGSSHAPAPGPIDADKALADSQARCREWIAQFDTSKTQWPDVVKRSLITLRALIHQPSGGLIAAPTTSLPEAPGGKMNWDYRYSWLRDATFTIGAMLNAGFTHEATRWRDWLLRAIAGSPEQMRIMYRVDGARHLNEWTADTLPGYRFSTPVHIGNAASTQHQIDVFGEVLDCLHLARVGGIPGSKQERDVTIAIAEHLLKVWNSEGSGVWESRGELRQYTYSKAMAWVGVDRVLKLLQGEQNDGGDAKLIERLSAARKTIHDEVCREGWHSGLGSFTQHYGGQALDASLLLLPLVGFLPADDPRIISTIEAIQRDLSQGGLIRRTKESSSGPHEGVFLACSCWMADCLNMMGRKEEARAQFERVLAIRNDVDLFSEEYNVPGKHMAGNFPQALTHLAVINTALELSGPVLHRGGG